MHVESVRTSTLLMQHRSILNLLYGSKPLKKRYIGYGHFNVAFYHNAEEHEEELLPTEWYSIAHAKLIKLTHVLKDVEQIDGRVTNINDNSTVTDGHIISQTQAFNSLAKLFIGSPSMQHALQKEVASGTQSMPYICFSKPSERESMTLDSLSKVCNFLNISAQQRKSVRLTVCPQVTQHHIWRGALEEVIKNLKSEMDSFKCYSPSLQMGGQIVSSCIKFLADATNLSDSDSPLWMRLSPVKKVGKLPPLRKWKEVSEMFEDLSKCLGQEERLACYVSKLEVMKEGLYQIKDILVERDISYKEAQRQDCLVQRKLSKSLGHSSKCLFTLLLYYLYGSVRDIEVEVCGGVHECGGRFYLCIGKILTSCDEKMIWNGVKQLNMALGVFKFVWETSAMSGVLELQGHLWCVGAEGRTLTYRGNVFVVHEIKL